MNRRILFVLPILALGAAALVTALLGPALWNLEIVRAFQRDGLLMIPMTTVTTLGSEGFFLVLLLAIYWCVNRLLGIELALLLVIAGTTNIITKAMLQRPRPFWDDPSLRLTTGRSFSTPSGHAANATVLFGYLAWRLLGGQSQRRLLGEGPAQGGQFEGELQNPQSAIRNRKSLQGLPLRTLTAVALVLCVCLVCLSRVYLGVHYPGDVIWGCAEGIVVLVAYIGLRPRAAAWLGERSLGTHVALATGAAAAVLVLNLGFLELEQAGRLLSEHVVRFALARSEAVGEAASASGLLWGVWVGLALERRHVRFTTSGPIGQRVLRYAVGLAGLLIIWLGPSMVLPVELPALGTGRQVVSSAAAALWAVFGWPWLFVRLALGQAEFPADAPGPAA